ncbi:MAG TPA: PPC domain-containing protein [Caulobacteraceae bacterium]|nr:PPC domain-containing protein [Caulobacteraceae bacterium]
MRFARIALLLGAALFATVPATVASAADPVAIKAGGSVHGTLAQGDRLEPDGSWFDVYAFDGKSGEAVTLEMRSSVFDSVVAVYVEGHDGPIAVNDNANRRGRDAKLEVTLPKDGRYLIVANAAESGEGGPYQLSLRAEKPIVAVKPSPRSIALGKTVQGLLNQKSGRAPDDSAYDLYRFRGKAGEQVRVSLSSNEFEPFVSVRKAGAAEELAFARDHGQRAAELTVTLPADGDYEVWANAATAGEVGRYRLWLGREDAARPAAVRSMAYGDTIYGQLTAGDAKARDDSLYDLYRFKAARGDEVTVTMRSPMVEPYLAIHHQGEAKSIATASDDGFGGRDAELTFVVPADGYYDVWANTLGSGQRGDYIISLERIGRHTGEVARNP